MKIILIPLLSLICLGYSRAQNTTEPEAVKDQGKEILVDFLKTFETYTNNPGNYEKNKTVLLGKFKSVNRKSVLNFLSARKKLDYVSPITFAHEISINFPDGFGLSFSSANIRFLDKKETPFYTIEAYSLPVEYSGLRKDNTLMSYSNEQVFYFKNNRWKTNSTPKLDRISDEKEYRKKFKKKLYRQGFFVEPYLAFASNAGVTYYESSSSFDGHQTNSIEYHDIGNDLGDMFDDFENLKVGIDAVYMIRPYFGIGTGISMWKEDATLETSAERYPLYQNFGYQLYIDTYNNQTYAYFKHIQKFSGVSMPLFIRLQAGWSVFSLSLDLGAGIISNSEVRNYLNGEIHYYGVSIENGMPDYENPNYGFGRYVYTGDFVGQYQPEGFMKYFLFRLNTHWQFNKYFYNRLSMSFKQVFDIQYYESQHMFDMIALRLPNSEIQMGLTNVSMEFSFGVNIFELIPTVGNRK